VHRGQPGARDVPFLSRLAAELPPVTGPAEHNEYLALLDRVLIDRVLSVRETDELVRMAATLGLDRPTATRLNNDYLLALARAALADGHLDEAEYQDLVVVAELLGLGDQAVRPALDQAWDEMPKRATDDRPSAVPAAPAFHLTEGDVVVFTGEMSRPRDELEQIATNAGLVPHPNVTKKVTVVVAADPDSLSGKARKAADYGIPIITEAAFLRLVAATTTRKASNLVAPTAPILA